MTNTYFDFLNTLYEYYTRLYTVSIGFKNDPGPKCEMLSKQFKAKKC